jgi:hypothetical protein
MQRCNGSQLFCELMAPKLMIGALCNELVMADSQLCNILVFLNLYACAGEQLSWKPVM